MFSFVSEPWDLVLNYIKQILPAAIKAIAIYYNSSKNIICVREFSPQENDFPFELDISSSYNKIKNLRIDTKEDNWLLPDEIPFGSNLESKKHNYDIFIENKRNILQLSFPNYYDNNYDLLYIYLPENNFVPGINSAVQKLSQENKIILSNTVKNSIKYVINTYNSDSKVYDELLSSVENLKSLLKKKGTEDNYKSRWIEYAQDILLTVEYDNINVEFSFSDKALELINNYKGKIVDFSDYIKKAAKNALITNNIKKTKNIIIEDFNFPALEIKKENIVQPVFNVDIEAKYQKTYILLDRYEEAAENVIRNRPLALRNKAISGTELGKYVGNGITAAAISDAIKKHKSKISKLLLKKELADKWPLLRKLFKPVINTLNTYNNIEEKTA